MIGYITVGTKDLKKAGEFYDKICGELGMGRFSHAGKRLGRFSGSRPSWLATSPGNTGRPGGSSRTGSVDMR